MMASSIERRFYHAFYRWNNALGLSKQSAHQSRRLLSYSATRKAEKVESSASHEIDTFTQDKELPLPSSQPHLATENSAEGSYEASVSSAVPPLERPKDLMAENGRYRNLNTLVRNVFRSVAHPIALVTALAESEDASSGEASFGGTSLTNEYEQALDSLRAMTISSLNTVSLDPEPMVSFNIRTPSSTWDAIKANQRFRIHLLRATERARDIAQSFAKGETREGFVRAMTDGLTVNLNRPGGVLRLTGGESRWDVEEKNVDPNPSPYLKSRAIACCLLCDLHVDKCVQVNDHVIVVGAVRNVHDVRKGFWTDPNKPRAPLLSYFNHEFVSVDRPIFANHSRDKKSTPVVHAPEHWDGNPKGRNKNRDQGKDAEESEDRQEGDQGVRNLFRRVEVKKLIRKLPSA